MSTISNSHATRKAPTPPLFGDGLGSNNSVLYK